MAQASVVLDKDQLNCSICLDVVKDPVTIPCGHSYCSGCIQNYWNQDDYLGIFACPQCRQTFNPRPVLNRNTMLADVVEKFKRTRLQEPSESVDQRLAEDGEAECDVCNDGGKLKAVRSCLVCLASYCDLHVRPHYDSAAFKKHKLVSANKRLRETICPRHDKLLEVYCRTDKRCICSLCLTDEHKGHDIVLIEEELEQKQRQLGDLKQSSQLWIQQREKEVQELRQAILSLTRSARAATEESDAVFNELIQSLELKRFEVRELVKAQEKTAIGEAERLLEQIQRELNELKKSEAELQKLSHADDPIHFIQSCQALNAPAVLSLLPSVTADPGLTFSSVTTAVLEFKVLLKDVCQDGFVTIYERVRNVAIVSPQHPAVQHDASQSVDTGSTAQTEAAPIPSLGLDQSAVNPLNPFLTPGPTVPIFAVPPLGFKLSSGSRLKHPQRRAHSRRT